MKLPSTERFADGPALGFDDVLIAPGQAVAESEALKLHTVLTQGVRLSLPYVVHVADAAKAIACAQQGVLGMLPHSLKPSQQAAAIRQVKRYQTRIVQNPVTVNLETSIAEVIDLQSRYDISGIPVIDQASLRVIGIVTKDSIKPDADTSLSVSTIMSQDGLILLQDSGNVDEVDALMRKHGVKRIILTDRDQRCIGMVTTRDMDRIRAIPHATMDSRSRLRVGATVGIEDADMDRVAMLIDEHVDVLMVLADPLQIKRSNDMVTHIRRQRAGHVEVLVGPTLTKDHARSLIDAGANALFVRPDFPADYTSCGIGNKALSLVLDIVDVCKVHDLPVYIHGLTVADHMIKALVAGCHGLLVDESHDRTASLQMLQQAMRRLGCPTLEQLRNDPHFISLK